MRTRTHLTHPTTTHPRMHNLATSLARTHARTGLGTGGGWVGNDTAVYAGVLQALSLGYRHFDTALGYHTQPSLARAIAASGVPR